MITQDDRTEDQKDTHKWAIVGLDKCMSGWGDAKGGSSRVAWACPEHSIDRVFKWVKSRGDIQRVKIERINLYSPPRSTAHFHIYVVDQNHPALTNA